MTLISERYQISIHPNRGDGAAKALALYIMRRWMPSSIGGKDELFTGGLQKSLAGLFAKATRESRDVKISIDTTQGRPFIAEVMT